MDGLWFFFVNWSWWLDGRWNLWRRQRAVHIDPFDWSLVLNRNIRVADFVLWERLVRFFKPGYDVFKNLTMLLILIVAESEIHDVLFTLFIRLLSLKRHQVFTLAFIHFLVLIIDNCCLDHVVFLLSIDRSHWKYFMLDKVKSIELRVCIHEAACLRINDGVNLW